MLGYDANALYLSTMLQDMPCGKDQIIHVPEEQKVRAAPRLVQNLKEGKWFGFAEIDLKVPEPLIPKVEEMCPFFINKQVLAEAVPTT